MQTGHQLDESVERSVRELGDGWPSRTHRAGRMAIKPMHNLNTAFKQSESDRSMAAKIPIAPGHPLPQVFTCTLRATTIFYKARSVE